MFHNLNEQIINKLNDLHLTISTCESMTGGAVGANLVLVEHASNCFLGSITTYHANAKKKLAKVSEETINEYGTVSKQCAREMAQGCQLAFNSDIAISVTGNASAGNPIENQPCGMAYIAICLFDKIYDYQFISHYQKRADIINECVAYVLTQIWDLIKGLKK